MLSERKIRPNGQFYLISNGKIQTRVTSGHSPNVTIQVSEKHSFRSPSMLLQRATALVVATVTVVTSAVSGLLGSQIVEQFLFGLSSLGLSLTGTHVLI